MNNYNNTSAPHNLPSNGKHDRCDKNPPSTVSEHGGTTSEVANLTAEVERLQASLAEAKASHQIEFDGVKAELERVKVDVFIAKTNAAVEVAHLALRKIPIADPDIRAVLRNYVTEDVLDGKEWMKQA